MGTKCVDEPIVSSLAAGFKGGIMQNMQNMEAVSSNFNELER
jgi:hypothetical protein